MHRTGFLAGLVWAAGLTACVANDPVESEELASPEEENPGEATQEIGGGLDRAGAGASATSARACGGTVCGEGLECCNASCGWCAPPGTFCIQIACVPTE